jgi:hypothetical protein
MPLCIAHPIWRRPPAAAEATALTRRRSLSVRVSRKALIHSPGGEIRVSKIAQNDFQTFGIFRFDYRAGCALGETRESKLEKGAFIEVTFFGEQALFGLCKPSIRSPLRLPLGWLLELGL